MTFSITLYPIIFTIFVHLEVWYVYKKKHLKRKKYISCSYYIIIISLTFVSCRWNWTYSLKLLEVDQLYLNWQGSNWWLYAFCDELQKNMNKVNLTDHILEITLKFVFLLYPLIVSLVLGTWLKQTIW